MIASPVSGIPKVAASPMQLEPFGYYCRENYMLTLDLKNRLLHKTPIFVMPTITIRNFMLFMLNMVGDYHRHVGHKKEPTLTHRLALLPQSQQL